ncbi:protein CANDIDATE G-PROTEIN COUPLED RECEPTOR 7-like [Bidens hawaiensis]|uniref:protein CANDIDATE G-PROTEIN COUPLED RECEPTOR 7-like n=1 Tax=Bidens hawaiensis TaxID=980011 RepID=UPI00404972D8
MIVLGKTVTAILLLFLFATPSTAAIKSIKIQSDNRPVILFHKFGFTHTGNLSITISNVSVTSTDSSYDPSLIGFYLLSDSTLIQLLQQSPTLCLMDLMFVSLFFTFRDLSPSQSSYHNWYPLTNPNEYALFFINCNPQTLVTMDVRTELYNTEHGATKNYLSVGLTQLPSLYFMFSILYLCFLGWWFSVCFKNQRFVHQIHSLMSLLLLFKAHSMFRAAVDEYYVKVTGNDPLGRNVLFYLFRFISSTLLFTVIILIGAGRSYLKPFLQAKEKIVFIIVIPFQVLANVASIVIDETGPFSKDWVTWNQVYMWSDAICYCAIFFPIGWLIKSLNELSNTDQKADRKLTLYVRFYRLVFGYFFFTRIGVVALMTISTYEYQWVSIAAEAVANLVLYLVMFYMFRPVEKSAYVVLEDKEASGMAK